MQVAVRYLMVALIGLLSLGWLASFRQSNDALSPAEEIGEAFLKDLRTLQGQVGQFQGLLTDVSEDNFEYAQETYLRLREQYKRVEPLLAHLQPEVTVQRINGAPLPKIDPMEESRPEVIQPVGLQVIDELVFAEDMVEQQPEIDRLLNLLKRELSLLNRYFAGGLTLTDRHVIEACRAELVRIMTLGVTGFDTPGSVHAIKDARVAMAQVTEMMLLYQPWLIESDQMDLALDMQARLEAAQTFLQQPTGFAGFDRMTFLRDHIDPLYGLLLEVHQALGIETLYEISPLRGPVNYMGRHLFSEDFFNRDAFVKLDAKDDEQIQQKVALGRYLFFDPVLSANHERSCASCHQPDQGFTDGLAKSLATDFNGTVERNAPTVINAVFADRFFHDLRSEELETQVDHVVFSEKEFNTTYSSLLGRLKESPEYLELFYAAYPRYRGTERPPINANTVKGALAAYVKSLSSFNSPFDRYARGETDEIDPAVQRGFNVFMGKGACGTCHFAPSFHGTVPPDYKESESEVLGVPAEPIWKKAALDPDEGRAVNGVPLDGADIYLYSFKTPTVRNIALTAPYMHNGVYQTLEEVMKFYNVGGGKGIGIHLENQTLPFDRLDLSQGEISDVIAFMQSLTDTTGLTAVPDRLPTYPDDSPYHQRIVGGEY